MAQIAPLRPKINTEVTQPSPARASRRRSKKRAGVAGEARSSVRDPGRAVIELDHGVTVYPPQAHGEPWRAVFIENGQRRYWQAGTEAKLAARLAKVTERLQADAPDMERPGADLIAWYLSPDRHPVGQPWSRKHADTQRRLCERFVAPVISGISCQDIKVADMQQVVNAAPTEGEGARLRRCLSAMVTAGIAGGYLANLRLKEVHWQAGHRAAPEPQVSASGETVQFVDPGEIPAAADVGRLGRALADGRNGELDELMANTAAYTGLRLGELSALMLSRCRYGPGHHGGPQGGRGRRQALPGGSQGPQAPQHDLPAGPRLATRWRRAGGPRRGGPGRAGSGRQPAGADVPVLAGGILALVQLRPARAAPAYLTAGWRDVDGNGDWIWHSLRHVFCVVALFTWKLDPTDVSCMAGHANVRTTLDMYVGSTAGVLDRARQATR